MTLSAAPGFAAPHLPSPAGALSDTLFDALRRPPFAMWDLPAPETDDDLHLTLYACYELGYVGFAEVDGDWEWEPSLVALRGSLERRFEATLREAIDTVADAPNGTVPERLQALIAADKSPSVARHLAAHGIEHELVELLIHRSAYLLKEADPHVRTIPRLPGRAKAAMVEVLADEYGGGRLEYMHSELYRQALKAFGLDGAYGATSTAFPV